MKHAFLSFDVLRSFRHPRLLGTDIYIQSIEQREDYLRLMVFFLGRQEDPVSEAFSSIQPTYNVCGQINPYIVENKLCLSKMRLVVYPSEK